MRRIDSRVADGSADLQSAVSPICNRQRAEGLLAVRRFRMLRRMQFCDTADCKSALRVWREHGCRIWVLAVSLTLALTACKPKGPPSQLEAGQALAAVLAEETAKAAGLKKQVVVISPGGAWGS